MKILIAGDYCPRARLLDLIDSGDYAAVFSEVVGYTKGADFSIVNLEAPIVHGEGEPIKKCGPNLKCNSLALEAIKYAGFDAVTLANNHIYDFGEKGISDTLDALANYQIDFVGAGRNIREAAKIFYRNIEEKRLAIINCCEHEFSIATEISGGANPLNPIQQYYAILEARKFADFVLVIVHGGHEHFQYPSPRMLETYRFFIDAGADAVINHHQHCYSGYEVYKRRPIFYGLGNFCFDSNQKTNSTWNKGYLVQLTLEADVVSFSLYPYTQCDDSPCVKILKDTTSFYDDLKNINSVLSDGKMLHQKMKDLSERRRQILMQIFSPYSNRYLKALSRRGLLPNFVTESRAIFLYNMIACESHRDLLLDNVKKNFWR